MTEENENGKSMAKWVEKRSEQITGRRQGDAHQCAMHDYLYGAAQADRCIIKEGSAAGAILFDFTADNVYDSTVIFIFEI